MTIFETERLLLEQAEIPDAPFFLKLLNSPGWIAQIGDRGIKTTEDATHYIRDALIKSYKENGFGLYKMIEKQEKQPIGICGLLKRPDLDYPDIGFAMLPEYEGNGYAFEAAKATLEYAETTLGLRVILAITIMKNTRSKKLLERIGLQQIDVINFKSKEECLLYSNEKT